MPLWVAIVVPIVAATLGLLGGGVVRYLLDRHQTMMRAQGFARVIREELRDVLVRLDPETPGLLPLPTGAWEQNSTEIAGAMLAEEFSGLTVTYRAIAEANWQLRNISTQVTEARPFSAEDVPGEVQATRGHVALLVTQVALPSLAWLADGDMPFLGRRRTRMVMTSDPSSLCRCGHRWDCHEWSWHGRGPWRLRWRHFEARSIGDGCNVEGCGCSWFREPGHVHLPRWIQRRGPGRQVTPPKEPQAPPPVDPSIPETAQPGAIVSAAAHDSFEESFGG